MGFIYLRTNKINGKKYVGQVITRRFKARQNRWNSNSYRYAGKAINNARAKYGIDVFDFEILKECDDKELDFWEKYYIKELNTKVPNGYNMTDGGEGRSGSSVSDETRRKMSETRKGKKMPPRSEEWRKKQREAHKGQKVSDETRRKIRIKAKGRKASEEAKRKMSKSQKNNPKKSKPVFQIDKYTNKIIAEFPSIIEVKRELGFDFGHISHCCLGQRKSAYGFKWRYKESVA